MTCAELEEHIALDAGGDLPKVHRVALDEHLQTCPSCRELAAALSETQQALGNWGRQPVDELWGAEVRRRVQAFITEENEPPAAIAGARRPSQTPTWGWAVAALLVLGLGLSLGSLREPVRDLPVGPTLVVQPTPTWDGAPSDAPGNPALAQAQAPAIELESSFAPPPPMPALASKTPPPTTTPTPSPPASNPEPMVIQLVSDDNSVVIHWLVAETS